MICYDFVNRPTEPKTMTCLLKMTERYKQRCPQTQDYDLLIVVCSNIVSISYCFRDPPA